jgi:hypothetical protein
MHANPFGASSGWTRPLPSIARARGNDLSLLAGIHASEGTDRFVRLHVVDFRLELDLPRFHPLKRLDNPI